MAVLLSMAQLDGPNSFCRSFILDQLVNCD